MSVCGVAGCGRPVKGHGLCGKHYRRFVRHGDPLYERPKHVCRIPGCGRPHEARDLCNAHYRRWRLYGDPLGGAVTQRLRPHANPWTGRVACPSCGEDEWTLPYDQAEPLWHCTRPACGAWFEVGLARSA